MGKEYAPEELISAVNALKRYEGNFNRAAKSLGLARSTLQHRIKRAAQLGFCGTDPVIPGFAIKQVSQETDAAGAVQKEWIKQRPLGDEFEIPHGHVIKGVSALVDPEGREVLKWIKTKNETSLETVTQALETAFANCNISPKLPAAPRQVDGDLITVYPVADHHLGLYAWAEEAGEDYDLEIGAKLLLNTMTDLVASAPRSKIGVVLNLGDFFHSDNDENRTRRGGNPLDADTRYAKVLRVGVDLLIHCVQLALQRHQKVSVRCLPGNHDPYGALALSIGVAKFFQNNKRVEMDISASRFFMLRFGKVLLTATHGDMFRHGDMPGVVAADYPQDWGATQFRYGYLGHVHHKSIGGGEKAGMIWETFQTLSPKDAWHHGAGYRSGRAMVAITHHKNKGEIMRHTVSVKGPA